MKFRIYDVMGRLVTPVDADNSAHAIQVAKALGVTAPVAEPLEWEDKDRQFRRLAWLDRQLASRPLFV